MHTPYPGIPAGNIVPVPHIIQQRAWECCLVLREDHSHVTGTSGANARWWCEAIVKAGPDSISWGQAGAAFRLYRNVFPERCT